MPRRKKTPAGGTAGAGAAGQVAAINASAPQYSTPVKPQQVSLPLELSRLVDCCLYVVENTQDPVIRSFGKIALRRLQAIIPSESQP